MSAGGYFEFHGEIFDVPAIKLAPVPTQPVPVLIGGHGEAALRRAAAAGDGWLHGGGNPADLPGLLSQLARYRAEYGTAARPFEVLVISADAYSADGIRRLADRGVTEVIVGFRWPYHAGPDTEPLQAKLDALRRYAEDVIGQARSLTSSRGSPCVSRRNS